ncbi:hypothetical protein C0J52_13388 [Blattella germanica]|nr:hypothetical protein C0J52_13388 [Blattella germanica]
MHLIPFLKFSKIVKIEYFKNLNTQKHTNYILFLYTILYTILIYWRRSVRISRRAKIRNTVIREKIKVKGTLTEDIKTAQLRWFGHVKRMREDRLPKKIFEWQPMGRRKRGRSDITWTEGIFKTMRETGRIDRNGVWL